MHRDLRGKGRGGERGERKKKGELHRKWRAGQVTKAEYREASSSCRKKVREAKARDAKTNKKGFFTHANRTRNKWQAVGPLGGGGGMEG